MQNGSATLKHESYDENSFKHDCKIMELFIKNAETYTKLSAGALLLTVTFAHEIAGVKKEDPLHPDWWTILSWLCFLLAILSGAFYQYIAVKFLEWKSGVARSHGNWIETLVRRPWPAYGVMLLAFYMGCILFTVSAVQNLRHTRNAAPSVAASPALLAGLC